MKILWLATKAPWPPIDGGRLLLHHTLEALAERGHEITLVAPVDASAFDLDEVAGRLRPICRPLLIAARPRPLIAAALQAQLERRPTSAVRHRHREVRERVRALLAAESFDLIQLEQVQAASALPPGTFGALPVVLRAQNVESDLWRLTASHRRLAGPLLRLEARRLARHEGEVVGRVAKTVALTREDAARLGELAGGRGGRVEVVPAPFLGRLPADAERLPGEPAIVLFGSAGWLPNRQGALWFIDRVWPRVRESLPEATLHVYGLELPGEVPGLVEHPPPAESRRAMPAGAILAVPLQIASGVRIKILEAWARGLPVVATPAAARGLDAEHGRELLLAEDAEGFSAAFSALASDPEHRERMVSAGRSRLASTHDPERVARRLEEVYDLLLEVDR